MQAMMNCFLITGVGIGTGAGISWLETREPLGPQLFLDLAGDHYQDPLVHYVFEPTVAILLHGPLPS